MVSVSRVMKSHFVVTLVILTFLLKVNCKPGGGENQWIHLVDDACIFVETDDEIYTVAADVCAQKNARLVEIPTVEFFNLLASQLGKSYYWTGAEKQTASYIWLSGGSITQSLWISGHPDMSLNHHCVVVKKEGIKLKDCTDDHDYICERNTVLDRYINCTYEVNSFSLIPPESTFWVHIQNGPGTSNIGQINEYQSTTGIAGYNYYDCSLHGLTVYGFGKEWIFDLKEQTVVHEIRLFINLIADEEIKVYIAHGLDSDGSLTSPSICARYYSLNSETQHLQLTMACSVPVGRYVSFQSNIWRWVWTTCGIAVYGHTCSTTLDFNCNDKGNNYLTLNPFQSATTTYEVTSQQETTIQETTTLEITTPEITTEVTTTSTGNPDVCYCKCSSLTRVFNQSNQDIEEQINEIVRELSVSAKTTSRYQRRLISAHDQRPSAQTVGYVGVILLTFTFGGIIFIDLTRFVPFVIGVLKMVRIKSASPSKGNGTLNEMSFTSGVTSTQDSMTLFSENGSAVISHVKVNQCNMTLSQINGISTNMIHDANSKCQKVKKVTLVKKIEFVNEEENTNLNNDSQATSENVAKLKDENADVIDNKN